MITICRHYADHLEDHAIAASGFTADLDGDSDADSKTSHGRSKNDKEEVKRDLATIEETPEEDGEGHIASAVEQSTQRAREDFSDFHPNCDICLVRR
jgi:hypothetical protein